MDWAETVFAKTKNSKRGRQFFMGQRFELRFGSTDGKVQQKLILMQKKD
jgi:hypothetical protein